MAGLRRGAEVNPREPRQRAGAGGARPRGVDRSEHRSMLLASAETFAPGRSQVSHPGGCSERAGVSEARSAWGDKWIDLPLMNNEWDAD